MAACRGARFGVPALLPGLPGLPRPAAGGGRTGRRAGLALREGERWRGRRAASGPALPGYLGAREGAAVELRSGGA